MDSKCILSMAKVCGICTDVDNSVAGTADDGLIVIQSKKYLGLLAASVVGHRNCAEHFTFRFCSVKVTTVMNV